MAAVIPEAAEATVTGERAVQGAGSAARTRPRAAAVPAPAPRNRRPQARQRAQRAGRTVTRARVPGNRNYQPVILAEFLVAVVVVALAPIAKGGTSTAQAKGSPSPYDTGTLKQILMIGLVYFILAIVSSGQRAGRYAAWFGGLVLAAVGIQQTVNGGFAGVIHMFTSSGGSGLGTFPAAPASGSLLPGLDINSGQFSGDALAQGVTVSQAPAIEGVQGPPPGVSATVINPVANATGIFPTLEPGGTITNSVITNGLPPSTNLA